MFKPSFMDRGQSASLAEQIEHTVQVRLGLIGADEQVYRAFPPLGIGADRLASWLQLPTIQPFYRARNEDGGGGWGRIDAYGQPCRQLGWDECQLRLPKDKLASFTRALGSAGEKSFAEGVQAIRQAELPGCVTAGTLSTLLLAG